MRANRLKAAFKESGNLASLTGAVATSLALLNPVPAIVALVAEAAYLLFVPDSKWYERRLAKRHDEEVRQRRHKLASQILPTLNADTQTRISRLEAARREIESQSLPDQMWFREVLRKLDYLLEKFLVFASRAEQYRRYLGAVQWEVRDSLRRSRRPSEPQPGKQRATTDSRKRGDNGPQHPASDNNEDIWVKAAVREVHEYLDGQVRNLDQLMQNESDDSTRAVMEKRSDLLKQRKESVARIGKIFINLNHQLQLLEDTFGLINDEIQARSPEQILSDIDEVVGQTDTMTQVLEEIAPYEQMISRMDQLEV